MHSYLHAALRDNVSLKRFQKIILFPGKHLTIIHITVTFCEWFCLVGGRDPLPVSNQNILICILLAYLCCKNKKGFIFLYNLHIKLSKEFQPSPVNFS